MVLVRYGLRLGKTLQYYVEMVLKYGTQKWEEMTMCQRLGTWLFQEYSTGVLIAAKLLCFLPPLHFILKYHQLLLLIRMETAL